MQGEDYAILGLAYAKIGELAKVKNVISKVDNEGEKQFLQYRINKFNKDYEGALYALEEALELQNDVVRTISTQDISSIGVEYFRYQDALKTQQLKVSYLTGGIICVFFCSVILLISIIIRYRHRLLKRELDENMALVGELRDKIIDNEDLLLNKQLLIEQLFSSHFEAFNRLSDAYYGCKGLSNEKLKIYNEVMSILSEIASSQNTIIKMEEFINRYKDGLMVKFNQSFPHFSRLDVNLFMYIVLGFSARAISIFLNEKIDVVYNRKSRLKQKIQKSDVLNKECFLELMR
jgi:tetratricopeptide (TPR) repeat protein